MNTTSTSQNPPVKAPTCSHSKAGSTYPELSVSLLTSPNAQMIASVVNTPVGMLTIFGVPAIIQPTTRKLQYTSEYDAMNPLPRPRTHTSRSWTSASSASPS
jgi:hypothetical protein